MQEIAQEIMTPKEAAAWFRRSLSWLRQQRDLLRVGGTQSQPLFHVRVCRAFMLARMCGATGAELRRAQLAALADACGIDAESINTGNRPPQLDEPGAFPTDDEPGAATGEHPADDENQQ